MQVKPTSLVLQNKDSSDFIFLKGGAHKVGFSFLFFRLWYVCTGC